MGCSQTQRLLEMFTTNCKSTSFYIDIRHIVHHLSTCFRDPFEALKPGLISNYLPLLPTWLGLSLSCSNFLKKLLQFSKKVAQKTVGSNAKKNNIASSPTHPFSSKCYISPSHAAYPLSTVSMPNLSKCLIFTLLLHIKRYVATNFC